MLIDGYAASEERDWPSLYHYQQAILFKLDILERLGKEEEFVQLARANADISDASLRLAEKLKSDGDVKAAIDTAEYYSKNLREPEVEGLNRFLAETYEEMGNYEKAIEKYYEMYVTLDVFEYYERLRELAAQTNTWPQVFESVVNNAGKWRGSKERALSEIYLREGMHKEAAQVAFKTEDLVVLEMVAEGIKGTHPVESYELYKKLVDLYLDGHMWRASYRQAAGFLMRMKRIGFDAEFNSYVEELTGRFWRRRALIDEIRQVATSFYYQSQLSY